MKKANEKEVIVGKYTTLNKCLKEYNKLLDEGRNVFWGQYPEGYYVIVEYIKQDE